MANGEMGAGPGASEYYIEWIMDKEDFTDRISFASGGSQTFDLTFSWTVGGEPTTTINKINIGSTQNNGNIVNIPVPVDSFLHYRTNNDDSASMQIDDITVVGDITGGTNINSSTKLSLVAQLADTNPPSTNLTYSFASKNMTVNKTDNLDAADNIILNIQNWGNTTTPNASDPPANDAVDIISDSNSTQQISATNIVWNTGGTSGNTPEISGLIFTDSEITSVAQTVVDANSGHNLDLTIIENVRNLIKNDTTTITGIKGTNNSVSLDTQIDIDGVNDGSSTTTSRTLTTLFTPYITFNTP
jgi:hypothetical protein